MKKQSDGNPEQPWQRKSFVLFLDEALHNCKPILEALEKMGVAHERHGMHFVPGTPDDQWLPIVGTNGWSLLTKDRKIRYNELEIRQIIRHKIREFVFASGNLSGAMMAEALTKAMPKLERLHRFHDPPFIACISRSGIVEIRYDNRGSVHDRRTRLKRSDTR